MSQCCKNCHFLFKGDNPPGFHNSKQESWLRDERENEIGNRDLGTHLDRVKLFSMSDHQNTIGCYKGIWNVVVRDDTSIESTKSRVDHELDKDRENICFFVFYREGMSFNAADEIQKRNWENKNTQRALMLTRRGLYISIVAMAITAIIQLARFWIPLAQ